MACHQQQTSFVTLIQLSRVVLWAENAISNFGFKDTQENIQEYIIFIASPEICHTSQGVIITLIMNYETFICIQ